MVAEILLVALFLATAVAIMVRPFGVGEGWIAVGAAAIALATGLVPVAVAGRDLGLTVDVLAFFAGLLALAWALTAAGVFEALTARIVRWSRGSQAWLLMGTAVAGAAVTAVLSNDACVLLFAPSILRVVRRLRLPALPHVLALAFIANTASLVLPTGNPVNLLILDRAHVSVVAFVRGLSPPALLATAGLLVALALGARALPKASFPFHDPLPRPDRALAWGVAALGALAAVDIAAVLLAVPLGLPTLAVGVVTASVLVWRRPAARLGLQRSPGWSLLPLVVGLSVLGSGLGGLASLTRVAEGLAGHGSGAGSALAVGAVTAAIAAGLNNLPAALLASAGLGAAHHLTRLALPVIAGADLGPNLAPGGSLSTLILFAQARRAGLHLGWGGFLRRAVWAGPLTLGPVLLLVAGR